MPVDPQVKVIIRPDASAAARWAALWRWLLAPSKENKKAAD